MSSVPFPSGSASILVVEDSPTQADFLVHVLEREGHRVAVADSGHLALTMLSEVLPDVVISDIVMPEMDGYDLCARIRADERLKEIPVILVTLLSDPKDVIRALEAGADGFVRKPYNEQHLLAQIRQAITNRGLRRQTLPGEGIPLSFDGQSYVITTDRAQALGLLLSTYEAAVEQNRELERARDALRQLNENLENRVRERTASLSAEVERRKTAERMLEEDRKILRTVLDAIPDSICLKDEELRYITGNAAFVHNLHETDPVRIAGKTDYDFLPHQAAEREQSLDRRVLSSGVPVETEERKKPNDHTIDLRVVRVPVRNEFGAVSALLLIRWDITFQKQAEEQIQHERNQLRTLIDNLPDLIYFKDAELRFVLSNIAHQRFLGLENESQIVGRSDMDFYPPETARESIERERSLLQGEKELRSFEKVVVDRHSNALSLETSQVPIFDDKSGRASGLVSISRDITERKVLERRLLQASKMEAIGRMSGGIAHDFNNMMAVINGFSDFLISSANVDELTKKTVTRIKEAGEKASAITAQLLTFSRRREAQTQSIDLNASIANLDGMLRRVLSGAIKLSVRSERGVWPISADATQIDQIILNLVINARDAMPEGGTVEIHTRNVSFDISYVGEQFDVPDGDYIMLAVSDTGIGMDEETRTRIFEPFFTTKEEGVGTGLGLAIVYGAVRDAKGDIRVVTALGQGTTFQIYLPRSPGR